MCFNGVSLQDTEAEDLGQGQTLMLDDLGTYITFPSEGESVETGV